MCEFRLFALRNLNKFPFSVFYEIFVCELCRPAIAAKLWLISSAWREILCGCCCCCKIVEEKVVRYCFL